MTDPLTGAATIVGLSVAANRRWIWSRTSLGELQRLGLMAVVVKRRQKELHSLRLTRLGRGLVTACTRGSVLQAS